MGPLTEKVCHVCVFCVFVLTVAPLCFLYNEPSKLYSVFREMYTRYFFRLHSISSSPSVRCFFLVFFLNTCTICQDHSIQFVYTLTTCLHFPLPAGHCISVPAV